ncbi:MAG: thioredoxin [Prolixibacteraceae bacterium]|jgi:thioredoxin 1|nr:thioredoxin [Prolixibacteraceae bacterium]
MRGFFGLMVILMLVVGNVGCSARSQKDADTGTNADSNENEFILYANDMASFNDLINNSKPVLVDFYADWCAPCKMMSPIIEQVADKMQDSVKVIKVNVDKNGQVAAKYGIRSIPTLMLFQNGEVKWQGVGVLQADQIEKIIKSKSIL